MEPEVHRWRQTRGEGRANLPHLKKRGENESTHFEFPAKGGPDEEQETRGGSVRQTARFQPIYFCPPWKAAAAARKAAAAGLWRRRNHLLVPLSQPTLFVRPTQLNQQGRREGREGGHSVLESVNIGHIPLFPDHWAAANGQKFAKVKRTTMKPLCDLRHSRHGRRASERGASAPCGVRAGRARSPSFSRRRPSVGDRSPSERDARPSTN